LIPVFKDDKLYGRGGGDDGYAIFAAISSIAALREQGIGHARCVVLIEASEESGSPDLPAYMDHLAPRLGTPSLVVCLDSGCANYDQLWLTTSLRGLCNSVMTVRVLEEGVHSAARQASFRRAFASSASFSRASRTKRRCITAGALCAGAARPHRSGPRCCRGLGDKVAGSYPFSRGVKPVTDDPTDLILNKTWRPQLAITGIEGLPQPENAGNVQLPFTTASLSLRLPPTLDAAKAGALLQKLLTTIRPTALKWS